MVAAICGRYKPLLYSICNAYLRKLSDKFKYWFFFTFFSQHPFGGMFSQIVYELYVCLGASVVGSVRCITDDMFQIYENHVDQSVATKKKIKLTLVLLRVHRKKNTEYACKTILKKEY